jgi:hypothetical protein
MGKLIAMKIVETMKNVTIAFILMVSVLSFAQDKSNKKFQFGVSYSLINDDGIFKKPFSGYANYQVKKWNNLDLNAGVRVFYFGSKESANFSNKLGFNPNIVTSFYFLKDKMNTYLGLGYYFDTTTFKPTPTILFTSPNQSINTSGFTITPGLKYFIIPNIFIDANLTFILSRTKYELGTSESNNDMFINIGAGIAF